MTELSVGQENVLIDTIRDISAVRLSLVMDSWCRNSMAHEKQFKHYTRLKD